MFRLGKYPKSFSENHNIRKKGRDFYAEYLLWRYERSDI